MKRVKVTTKYPDEVSWISFEKIKNWTHPVRKGFQYDSISNELIVMALAHPYLNKIDISIDWEDDHALREQKDIHEELKHPLRIAKLIEHIRNDGGINPVDLDTYSNCCSCICNGHHRIRALQFLGYDCFPAYCSGIVSLINDLTNSN